LIQPAAPAAEELQHLPLRAIVALCVRCASRYRPEFDLPGTNPDRAAIMAALDAAIRLAAQFANGQSIATDNSSVASAAMTAAGKIPRNMFGVPATKAGMAASVAQTAQSGWIEVIPARAELCIRSVGEAALAARRDYDKLLDLRLGEFPDLGSPINPSEAGPLGPLWDPEDVETGAAPDPGHM
jgi:hypothetical protein